MFTKRYSFRNYTLGTGLMTLGSWVSFTASSWLVFDFTKSALAVLGVAAVESLPGVLASLMSMQLTERWSRKTVLLWTASAEAVLMATLGFVSMSDMLSYWLLTVLLLGVGLVRAVQQPVLDAYAGDLTDCPEAMHKRVVWENASKVLSFVVCLVGFFAFYNSGTTTSQEALSWAYFFRCAVSCVAVFVLAFTWPLAVSKAKHLKNSASKMAVPLFDAFKSVYQKLVRTWAEPFPRMMLLFVVVHEALSGTYFLLPGYLQQTMGSEEAMPEFMLLRLLGVVVSAAGVWVAMTPWAKKHLRFNSVRVAVALMLMNSVGQFVFPLLSNEWTLRVLYPLTWMVCELSWVGVLSLLLNGGKSSKQAGDDPSTTTEDSERRGRYFATLSAALALRAVMHLPVALLADLTSEGTALSVTGGLSMVLLAGLWKHYLAKRQVQLAFQN